MVTKPTIYQAGPVQHADDHGVNWRENVAERHDIFDWNDPLAAYNNAEASVEEEWTNERIVQKDLEMIDESDALLVRWDDTVSSAGTPMEVFYANQYRSIPVATVYTGDEISPWMSHHSTVVVEHFDAAVSALDAILGDGAPVESPHTVNEYDAEGDIEEINRLRADGGVPSSQTDGVVTPDPPEDEYQIGDTYAVSENEATAQSIPEDAAETLASRSTHGEAVENHRHIADLWSAYLGEEVSARNVADMMQLVKMSRADTGEVARDHYVDICGYAGISWACAVADDESVDKGV